MKILFLLIMLAGFISFNWDKVPKPIRTVSEKVWEKGSEIVEKGEHVPEPVKRHVDSTVDIIRVRFDDLTR